MLCAEKCCGISLRTGSLLILWIDLMSGIGSFFQIASIDFTDERMKPFSDLQQFKTYTLLIGLVNIIIITAGIIGIHKNKRELLLPFIASQVLHLFVSVIVLGCLLFFSTAISSIFETFIDKAAKEGTNPNEFHQLNSLIQSLTFSLIIVSIISIVMGAYFTTVVFSCYEQMGRPMNPAKFIYSVPPKSSTGLEYGLPQMEVPLFYEFHEGPTDPLYPVKH